MAIIDQAGLVAEAESESCEHNKSNDAEDAFIRLRFSREAWVLFWWFGGKVMEGFDCEVGG